MESTGSKSQGKHPVHMENKIRTFAITLSKQNNLSSYVMLRVKAR